MAVEVTATYVQAVAWLTSNNRNRASVVTLRSVRNYQGDLDKDL